jgi:hypothetical protein
MCTGPFLDWGEGVYRAVPRFGGGGRGVYIHIFMFTYRKNNRFQKKSVGQNTNIWIYTPPPPPPPPPPYYRSSYGPVWDRKDYCIEAYIGTFTIYNGNWTEWSAIWTEIKRIITKSHDREAGVRFVITSLFSVQNCTTRSSISTLLIHFEILNIFVNQKLFCLQKTHLRYLPECCSIATISEQDELSFVKLQFINNTFKILQKC